MDDSYRELAQRDAKAIRGGIVVTLVAVPAAVVGLFTPAIVGVLAALVGLLAQGNATAAWLAGPRWMAARRLVLAPGVVAGLAVVVGVYGAFGILPAIVASLPTAALATIVLGMTVAEHRA